MPGTHRLREAGTRVAQQRKDWACRKAHTIPAVMISFSERWALQLLSDLPPCHLCWLPKWPSPLSAQMQTPPGSSSREDHVNCAVFTVVMLRTPGPQQLSAPAAKQGQRHFQFSFNTLITPSTNLQDLTNKQLSFSSLKTLITTYLRWRREKSCLGSQAVWALGNAYRYFWANVFVCLLQQQFLLGNMTLKDPKFIQLTWTTWGKATPYATLRMVSQVTTLRFP